MLTHRRATATQLAWVFTVFVLGVSGGAAAHMDMSFPTARYPIVLGDENKACPCGVGGTNRTCDIPVAQQVDNNRDESRVTTFQAGEAITLVFDEYIGHAGRWRVAFDPDGAETADFNANILLDVEDPAWGAGNAGGSIWNLEVTLPDTPCDNCTLQLVQMMDGNTTDPVPDPTGRSSYYQCADIVLLGDESDGGPQPDESDGGPQSDEPDGGAGDDDGVPPAGGCSHTTANNADGGFGVWVAIGGGIGFALFRRKRQRDGAARAA